MKKIIFISSVLMALLVLSIVVIHVTPKKANQTGIPTSVLMQKLADEIRASNKAAQFDIPEKPAGMEELAPSIDVTSRIKKPIELVKEK